MSHTDASDLLSTKLTPPRLGSALVLREPLLARLDEGLEHKLTLLSAPAGFGKTTLVVEWLHDLRFTLDLPLVAGQAIYDFGLNFAKKPTTRNPQSSILNPQVAWLSLDEGDNDPVRFWRYVITACQIFDTEVGASALALLRTPQQPAFETALTMLINELARLSSKSILVLEDYHVITSDQIHKTIAFLLDHLPAMLHLIMITRSDPPLPLARLRARNELYELRAADLRFSLAETQIFLQQTIPFPISAEAIEHLDARTEGWAAGLRLVALALQGRQEAQEIEQFLATFAGSHRHILEYLTEVLSAQPGPLQEFLLQTTFLSRLTASLCDAITGRNDSGLMLEQLERANLFLAPLDGAGQWYRYHGLFAEAMHQYAQRRLGEGGLHELYNKASLWYEQHGLLAEAVETSLSAQEFSRTAMLIERLIEPRGFIYEVQTLRRWLARLPEAVLYSHPRLCLAYATVVLFTSDRGAPGTVAILQEPLKVAEEAWQAEGNRAKLGEALALRALVFWLQGDFGPAFAVAREALELLPEENIHWRGISLIFVGVEELLAGKLAVARQTLVRALTLCKSAENPYGTLDTSLILGQVCVGQGELRQAAQFYRQVLTETEQAPMDKDQALIRQGRALIGLSIVELEWNALETAKQSASQAFEIGQRQADEDLIIHSTLVLAQALQAREETAQAQQLLHALIAQTKRPLLVREVQASQAQLALTAGDLAAVQRWSTSRVQADDNLPRLQQEREALILARLLIAQNQAEAVFRLLEDWQPEAQAQGRGGSELEILVLKALAYFNYNNLPQAGQTLREALALAQPEGYQRLFLNEGKPMAALLQAVLSDIHEEPLLAYAKSLLATFPDFDLRISAQAPIVNRKSEIVNLVEPLSPQEQRVLRLLAAGLSNPEIAQELVVSLNTIKTQVKSIYRKLDVHSREEAQDVARRFNLL
jgi:LuxR family maltose regulon positive regulatory protein